MYRHIVTSIFLSSTIIVSCSEPEKNERGEVEFKSVSLVEIEEQIEPPPPGIDSSFNSLEEWLFSVCDREKPDKFIAVFKVGLFESTDGNVIYLAGVNKFNVGDTSYSSVGFKSSNMYFKLPQSQYSGLSRDQLLEKLAVELRAFTNTDKFKSSFLATANIILLEPNDQAIWKNKKISTRW
ncbi:MAG: hypothetical protein J7497_16185 [Chitinophagaceae bacterium]|nr:hypothetical protein [Chitinophagaceae bacterium]